VTAPRANRSKKSPPGLFLGEKKVFFFSEFFGPASKLFRTVRSITFGETAKADPCICPIGAITNTM
jgi:hypothetical protein